MNRVCDWELVPLSSLSILFPILFLSNLSNLFSVFQFLDLCNGKSNLPGPQECMD